MSKLDPNSIPVEFKNDIFNNIALPSYRDDIITSGNARKFWSKSDYVCTILVAIIASNISMFAAFKMNTIVIVLSSLLVSLQMFSLTAVAQAHKCTSIYDNLLSKIGLAPLAQDITLDSIQSQRLEQSRNPIFSQIYRQKNRFASGNDARGTSSLNEGILGKTNDNNV